MSENLLRPPIRPTQDDAASISVYAAAYSAYEQDVLSKVKSYVNAGREAYRKEQAFTDLPKTIAHVNGDYTALKPKALSGVYDNRTQKIAFDTASALTGVRPVWSYTTYRDQYKRQADVFSKAARYWWRNTSADTSLLLAILDAEAGASSYLLQQWNPELNGFGDIELLPLSIADVLPIGPVFSKSIQDWQGVVIRQSVPIESLVNEHPTKETQIRASTGSWFGRPDAPKKGLAGMFASTYSRLFASASDTPSESVEGSVDVMWIFIKDYKIHTGLEPREMGEPGKSWTYTVKPGERLYPRGRFIKCVQQAVLGDGPNQYWHGNFPLTRITLLPLHWSLLGASLLADFAPLQASLNDVLRGLEDNIAQQLRPAIVTNSSMAQNKLNALDMRQPGQKVRINMQAGEQFELKPVNMLPPYVLEYIKYLKDEMDDNSGSRSLKMLEQMKQMPSSDSMDKILDAMSPKLGLMARQIEVALADVASMFLSNVMQFYTLPRRYQMLGKDGVTMEDFDFDPNTMVPAPEDPTKDSLENRAKRAIEHKRNFVFSVERNTFLEVSMVTRQLQILQLFRSNAISVWDLWDAFSLTGVGPEPAPTLEGRLEWAHKKGLQPGLTEDVAAAQRALVLAQAAQAMAQTGLQNPSMGAPPGGGNGAAPPPPQGAPPTSGVGPQGGRPGTAQVPPHMETRNSPTGPRPVLSESR